MTLVKADGTGTYLRLGVSAGGQTGTLPSRPPENPGRLRVSNDSDNLRD